MVTQKRKVQTYVDDVLGARLDEYAARLGLSTSLAVSKALESFFDPSVGTDSVVLDAEQYDIQISHLYSELEHTQNQSEAAFDLAEQAQKELVEMRQIVNENSRFCETLYRTLNQAIGIVHDVLPGSSS